MSNQFPIHIKKIVSKSINEPTHSKVKTIFEGLKNNCPNLYKYIKNVK